MENIEIFTNAFTDQGEAIMHEVEMKVEVLARLDKVQDPDLDQGLEKEAELPAGNIMAEQGAAGGQGYVHKGLSTESRRTFQPIVGKKKERSASVPSPTAKERIQDEEEVVVGKREQQQVSHSSKECGRD